MIEHSPKAARLHAIAILGRSRVTRGLTSLIASLNDKDEDIRQEGIKAIVLFGDLALPAIEESFEGHLWVGINDTDLVYLRSVVGALSEINTGPAARALLKLYDRSAGTLDLTISTELSQMMTNPFVEADLHELEITQLPVSLRTLAIDRNGWSHKRAHAGFWLLDTKLRHDILGWLLGLNPQVAVNPRRLSFKVTFPTLLSYLRSLPKMPSTEGVAVQNSQSALYQGLLSAFGFEELEPNKIKYLINQMRTNAAIPLDLALQRVYRSPKADYTESRSLARKTIIWAAMAYFMIFYFGVLYAAWYFPGMLAMLNDNTPTLLQVYPVPYRIFSLMILGLPVLFYLSLIVFTKLRMQKGTVGKQFGLLIASPIPRFMTVLPYVTRYRPWIKLFAFQILTLTLSPFGHIVVWLIMSKQLNPHFSTHLDAFDIFYLLAPVFFLPLSFAYWRFQVLSQNPVYELIKMHPQGRKLIEEAN